MSDITYTYSIIKYVHDPSVGESLNIGVVLWSPELSILDFRFEHRYERLSKTFAGFDGENYRHHLARFTRALSALGDTQEPTLLSSFVRRCDEVGEFTRQIWTDEDLSFQAGPTLAGITSDIEQALLDIFDRMVTSQYPFTRPERRDDGEVWQSYRKHFEKRKLNRKFKEWTLQSDDVEIKYDYAFKNGNWHVLEPVSFDYSSPTGVQNKALNILGNATAIKDFKELGTVYLLIGKPLHERTWPAFIRAQTLLRKLPSNHRVITENQAEAFAEELAQYMLDHKLIDPE